MRPVVFIAAVIPLFCATADQRPFVCLDDRVGLGVHARQAFDRELALLTESSVRFADKPCSEAVHIRISIRAHAPDRYATALGLAYTRETRVLPVIEIYTANVARILEHHGRTERFGRALARVAYHELLHYLRQEPHHDQEGLFTAILSASELVATSR